ncbi:MAG: mechanosensitive ion channel family protein [Paracoccaceae bacterium]|nr:mechanosensitive ion channel family protein [Paracoccaceae bacterium]
MNWKTIAITVFVAVLTTVPVQGRAQSADQSAASVSDPYGRATPRGTVDGYLKAMREADLAKAALFLDTRGLTEAEGSRRAMQLKRLLDDGGYFLLTDEISANPEGNLSDEMSADLEEVGALRDGHREVPLILQRVADGGGAYVWLFARTTIEEIPELHRRASESLLDRVLPERFKTYKVLTVPIGHWLGMAVVAAFAAALGYALARLILKALDWLFMARTGSPLNVRSIVVPLGTVIAVALYRETVILIGVQVVARGATDWIAVTVLWLAIAFLCLKLVDLIADVLRNAVQPDDHRASLAALILLRKVVKAIILAVITIQVLEILGFDVTTAIAALGIGGLALALGAQKTVENLVGSVNVVADRPVEVGDFCKFGDISGTVEDIGIRSTKIRTPARTIVTVPNGTFASMQIENFSVRDQFLFTTVLSLRCDTSADQVTGIIEAVRQKLETSEHIAPGPRVNLIELTRASLDIEVFSYVIAPDYVSFLNVREKLLLFLFDTVTTKGSVLAFPPSRLHILPDASGD